ncbi:hypothetical protein EGI22_17455 [Lacihabitans sp. LS3-19]|uniref:hypothetical protein n=1 Tax=Lacihabitans sp. LS3-19 TaxID=2487335 RepID=UPI0020CE3762|nr:hypothetical protein [Lacihabitans sp. LS3-19]MCP9769693.1 hypothetical protein [Lacihabitans sp. LS3-19]
MKHYLIYLKIALYTFTLVISFIKSSTVLITIGLGKKLCNFPFWSKGKRAALPDTDSKYAFAVSLVSLFPLILHCNLLRDDVENKSRSMNWETKVASVTLPDSSFENLYKSIPAMLRLLPSYVRISVFDRRNKWFNLPFIYFN